MLAARTGLDARLQAAVEAGRRTGSAAVLLLVAVEDEDGGAPRGRLRGVVTRRLRAAVRSQDVLVELRPGLHALLLLDTLAAQAEAVAERVSDAVLMTLESCTRDAPQPLRVSVGASLSPCRAGSATEALRQAGHALEVARADGGDCARIWRSPR